MNKMLSLCMKFLFNRDGFYMYKIYQKLSEAIKTNMNEGNLQNASADDFKHLLPTTDRYRIYLHFPFCTKLCRNCPFSRQLADDILIDNYCKALIQEITIIGELYNKLTDGKKKPSIFFGGGTPTLIPLDYVKKIMDKLKLYFIKDMSDVEVSIECHPLSITSEKIDIYREAGINRLSIGVQSFEDHVLKEMGRNHTGEDAVQAIELIKKKGINFNIDLMYGFDVQTLPGFLSDIQKAIDLGAPHVSIYNYVKKLDDKAADKLEKKQTAMYYAAQKLFRNSKFKQYSIDDFVSDINNKSEYMVDQIAIPRCQTLVFGTGARGLANDNRYYTKYTNVENYIKCINHQTPPLYFLSGKSDNSNGIAMAVLMGLHAISINRHAFKSEFNADLVDISNKLVSGFIKFGLLKVNKNEIKLHDNKVQVFKTLFRKLQCYDIKPPKDPAVLFD